MNNHWLLSIAAYFLGSIPFGLLIVKVTAGTDIREKGSGNIGAANVARNVGAFAGALTLLFDAAKGYLAVWLAGYFTHGNIRWMAIAAVAAVIGHMFPIWLNFRGGKGVATGLGVILPICWEATAAGIVLWLLVVVFWRYSSLGSIVAAAAMPVFVYFLYAPRHAPPDIVTVSTTLIAALVIIKHRSNIERLIAGNESKLKFTR
jgi:glycerol-3-phosphate acyltransferase PlsY